MKQITFALAVKSLGSNEQRILTGTATAPEIDRVGDSIAPLGCSFADTLPLLLFHSHEKPVGTVKLGRPTATGIAFEAKIAKVEEPGLLRDRTDEAWHMVRHGLVRHVSVGFAPVTDRIEYLASGGVRYGACEILELSLVPVPAQSLATIETIKAASRGSNPMANRRVLTLSITRGLQIIVCPAEDPGRAVTIGLNRLSAQNIARALREYSGVDAADVTKGHGGEVTFAAYDETARPPEPKRSSPVKLGSSKRRVVSVGR